MAHDLKIKQLCEILDMTAIPAESEEKDSKTNIHQSEQKEIIIEEKITMNFKKDQTKPKRKWKKMLYTTIFSISWLIIILIIAFLLLGMILFVVNTYQDRTEQINNQQFDDCWTIECDSDYIEWSYQNTYIKGRKYGRLDISMTIFIPQNQSDEIYHLNFNTQIFDVSGFRKYQFSFSLILPDTATIVLQQYNSTSKQFDIISKAFFTPSDGWKNIQIFIIHDDELILLCFYVIIFIILSFTLYGMIRAPIECLLHGY